MHLLFAGGIGVTPLLSMAYALQRAGTPFQLAYFVRSEGDNAFIDELESGPLARHVVVLAGLTPQENAARIEDIMHAAPTSQTTVYTCGPAPFMVAVITLRAACFGAGSVHKESFCAPSQTAVEASFTLRPVRSGRDMRSPLAAVRSPACTKWHCD